MSQSVAVRPSTWTCLSPHVPLEKAKAANSIIGRSSNGAGIIGHELLVFSGENTPRVPIDDCIHVFNISTKQWRKIEKKADQVWPCARIGHAGAVVGQAFYISGGRTAYEADETLNDLWKFDYTSQTWTKLETHGSKPCPLSYHVFSSFGPFIYSFGGCTLNHGRTNGLWRFDTTNNTWSELFTPKEVVNNDAPCSRGGPSLAAVEKGVYVAFGYNGKEEQEDLWFFDFSTSKWTKIEPVGVKPTARSVTDLVALPTLTPTGASLFVFGGEFTPSAQGHEGAGAYHQDAFIFNTKTNTWEETKPSDVSTVPVARGWFNSLLYGTNEVIVFGGFSGDERRNDVYLWSPTK